MMKMKRAVATRLHTSNEAIPIDVEKIKCWCEDALGYCDLLVLVLDDRHYQKLKGLFEEFGNRVKLFHVHPWISYTQPLNMIVEKALVLGVTHLLFQSIEVTVSKEDVQKLADHMDENTLVIGAKLHEKHGRRQGMQLLNGWNAPWNTLALWNLQKLGLTGFLTISSGNIDGIPGGVEEVVAISLLQHLQPSKMTAKLITLDSVHWNASWECEYRTKYHESKMASKQERAMAQLEVLHIQDGVVFVCDEGRSTSPTAP